MDNLFTCACDFRGGTYVSQVRAEDQNQAILGWAQNFKDRHPLAKDSAGIGLAVLQEIGEEDSPMALTGLVNAWSVASWFDGSLVLLNIIKTALD